MVAPKSRGRWVRPPRGTAQAPYGHMGIAYRAQLTTACWAKSVRVGSGRSNRPRPHGRLHGHGCMGVAAWAWLHGHGCVGVAVRLSRQRGLPRTLGARRRPACPPREGMPGLCPARGQASLAHRRGPRPSAAGLGRMGNFATAPACVAPRAKGDPRAVFGSLPAATGISTHLGLTGRATLQHFGSYGI